MMTIAVEMDYEQIVTREFYLTAMTGDFLGCMAFKHTGQAEVYRDGSKASLFRASEEWSFRRT